jgi:hypothetical protein
VLDRVFLVFSNYDIVEIQYCIILEIRLWYLHEIHIYIKVFNFPVIVFHVDMWKKEQGISCRYV